MKRLGEKVEVEVRWKGVERRRKEVMVVNRGLFNRLCT